MKSPMLLWREIAQELGDWCRVSTTRDWETVTRRVEEEGISFLTITLPDFGKHFDECLDLGHVDHVHFAGFKRMKGLPRFLGGFLDQIFDRNTGSLLDIPSHDAIFAVRQLTRLFSKVSLKCSYERERDAYATYIKTDLELAEREREWTPEFLRKFSRVSHLLFGSVFSHMDSLHGTGRLIPKHGPGRTADRLFGNEKFDLSEWHWRLERGGFHSVDFILPSPRFYQNLDRIQFSHPGDERPSRVTAVPKTLKTPRIIAIEPTCMQYAQQSVAEPLVELLETDSVSRHFVGFTDQVPNQQLARIGSRDQSLATLDLSEASDRVSNQLVEIMLNGYTHLRDAVESSRSLQADVPVHGVIRLNKFASMGSALCFPIEAMVFTTAVFMGIEESQGSRLTDRTIKSMIGRVRVYGDDIIVPVEYTQAVIGVLEALGFKVNQHKSFWNGNFRESCGKEYFRGVDVSVVKLREFPPLSLQNARGCISFVSFRNQLYDRGFRDALEMIDSHMKWVLKGHYPVVSRDSDVLGRFSDEMDYSISSLSRETHVPLVKGWVPYAPLPEIPLDGEGALLKFFLKRGGLPSADEKHLERSGRPLAVGIKLRMAPV